MKSKINLLVFLCFALFIFSSCSDDSESSTEIGGQQSPFGELGNEIEIGPVQGVSGVQVFVSNLQNGVSTFSGSATTDNDSYIDLLEMVPTERFPGTLTISGKTVEANINAKVTDEGAQVIFNNGTKLTIVDYDAKVGDTFTATVGGKTLKNEVVAKSTEDDFYWGGMNIKVTKVKYHTLSPGIDDVFYYYNHKFGIVGFDIIFEDGSTKYVSTFF